MNDGKKISETERDNRLLMALHGACAVVMTLFIVLQWIGDGSSLLYALLTAVFGWLPFVLRLAFWYKNKESRAAEHDVEAQEELAEKMSDVSRRLHKSVNAIHEQMNKLNESSKATQDAMQAVSEGTADTAQAIQKQIVQTEEIQGKAGMVEEAAESITDSMNQTLQALEDAGEHMTELINQVELSVANSEDVADKLAMLDQYIEEMNSIVALIKGIASQTSMLALNASIEAARAGEAGRGFAVVASQISGMATQTKDATGHITGLIENISRAITEVVGVVREMISGVNKERDATENAVQGFADIQINAMAIGENAGTLMQSIEELNTANSVIMDSIQTISAISQEVSVHAGTTLEAEEDNAGIIEQIDAQIKGLLAHIQES